MFTIYEKPGKQEVRECATLEAAQTELHERVTKITKHFLTNRWNRTTSAAEAFKIPRDQVTLEHEESQTTYDHIYKVFADLHFIEKVEYTC